MLFVNRAVKLFLDCNELLCIPLAKSKKVQRKQPHALVTELFIAVVKDFGTNKFGRCNMVLVLT